MPRPTVRFLAGGRLYTTKKAIQEDVRACLKTKRLFDPFCSELLSDLVQSYHYYCKREGLRPAKFRKKPRARGGYTLQGWFEGVGWHGVSYLKCLTPPTFETEMTKALRTVVEPVVWAKKKPCCEKCGSTYQLEQDHVEPKFKTILTRCLAVAGEEERSAWETFDWLKEETFTLPPSCPAVKLALELHETAVIQTLCAPCHRNVKRPRARKTKSAVVIPPL
jgi:hypothetical protein